jgi:hypothetical protein
MLNDAIINNYSISTIDIGNAFLESRLDKRIVMELPKDLCKLIGIENMDVEVMNALYGLKQAGRLWFELLSKILIEYGCTENIYDPCVFMFTNGKKFIKISCHVDDLLIISNCDDERRKFYQYFESKLEKVKINESTQFSFLGINVNVAKDKKIIYLDQKRYVEDIINTHLKESTPGSNYPIRDIDLNEYKVGCGNNNSIQDIIGKLRFLTDRTRPDLLYPVNYLSRFMVDPSDEVMEELSRILRYIKRTANYQLCLDGSKIVDFYGMCDSSFVQIEECKSQIGYTIFMNNQSGSLSTYSKRAPTVSISSTQAETDALVELIKEIIWYRGFLESIGIKVNGPTPIYMDNKPVVTLSGEGNHIKKNKHFVVKTACIKEKVREGIVKIYHVAGVNNCTDILTKALSGTPLYKHTLTILGYKGLNEHERE